MAQQSSRIPKADQKKNVVVSTTKPLKSFNKPGGKTTPSEVVLSESKPKQNVKKPSGKSTPSEVIASKSKPPRSFKKPSGKSTPLEVVSKSKPPGCINKPSDKTTPSEVEAVENHFKVGNKLGEGVFEAFKEGRRLSDGLQVALKYLPKSSVVKFLKVTGYQDPIPLEIALMIKMQKTCIYPQIIKLLEWYDEPEQYVLVMEWPADSVGLGTFLERHGGSIDEKTARIIMRQVIQAALACCKRRVLHRDIKIENLLINTKTLEVKLINFGSGDKLKRGFFKEPAGIVRYMPLQMFFRHKYSGKPATVWSLGRLLFRMLCGRYPHGYELQKIHLKTWTREDLSEQACLLIRSCMQIEEYNRPSLDKILKQSWFQETTKETRGNAYFYKKQY